MFRHQEWVIVELNNDGFNRICKLLQFSATKSSLEEYLAVPREAWTSAALYQIKGTGKRWDYRTSDEYKAKAIANLEIKQTELGLNQRNDDKTIEFNGKKLKIDAESIGYARECLGFDAKEQSEDIFNLSFRQLKTFCKRKKIKLPENFISMDHLQRRQWVFDHAAQLDDPSDDWLDVDNEDRDPFHGKKSEGFGLFA